MPVDPRRVLAELDELAALTGDAGGAQRVAWTPVWARARAWLAERVGALGLAVEQDEAGNRWALLEAREPAGPVVAVGSHLDSVPDGGRLDGALGVLAGLEVLRALREEDVAPPVGLVLVDFADEEGARFGSSLLGSGLAAGTLRPDEVRGLRDADGVALPDALREHGVELDAAPAAGLRIAGLAAFLELHIEQGPVLEHEGGALAAVAGTMGVERHRVRFTGQAAHAGAAPMELRRDPMVAAARFVLAVQARARAVAQGRATVGRLDARPGIPTAVPGVVELLLDLRHADADALAGLLAGARADAASAAQAQWVDVAFEPIWSIAPVAFHEELVELARTATERDGALVSGALHDAAALATAGVPTTMLFVQSLRGLSHTAQEDTRPEHVEQAVVALDRLVRATLVWAAHRAVR